MHDGQVQQVWTDNIQENSANCSNQLLQAVTQPANFEDLLERFLPPTSDFASPMFFMFWRKIPIYIYGWV